MHLLICWWKLRFFSIFSYIPAEAGYILMILIMFFTFLFNLPRFFELKTLSLPHCKYVTVEPTVLRLSPAYSTITMVSSVVFLNIIPFICLIFINKQIYSVVQQKIRILKTLNKRKVVRFASLTKILSIFPSAPWYHRVFSVGLHRGHLSHWLRPILVFSLSLDQAEQYLS